MTKFPNNLFATDIVDRDDDTTSSDSGESTEYSDNSEYNEYACNR
jgi:hypothetical protein